MDKKLNILVVEDSEDDALLVIIQIKKGGYDVYYECVETQDDMYAALNEKTWDIILSDYKMPRFNGLDALKLFKETGIDIPFIIISGTIGEEIAVMAMKEGAHDYIMKENLQRLLPAVERELREAKSREERKRIEQKQKQAEEALRESEIKFRSIYEMAEEMICVTDLQTMSFLDVNPSGLRILGYTKKEFLKHLIIEYVHPDDVEHTKNIFKDKLQNGKTVISFVNRFKCKNGNYRWLDWSIHPIAEKNITYAIAHDITEIKKYQSELENHKDNLEQLVKERTKLLEKTLKELKDTEMQLIQTEKMVSLGILTAGVAHEINNPLNYIQTSIYGLENMFKHGFDSDILEKLIKNMKVGVNKASAIVKSLNTFSRKGQGKLSPCNINVIIENCLLLLNHELKKNCKVTKNFTNDSFIFMANEENLHQVFINLIMNSLQAIESEGEISISTQLIREKELLQINVIDNGGGISDENLSKIFDPFFTTKEPGKGIGIGLSIVYKIITDHQGTINYKSELSKGTQVTINFPIKIMSQHENERKI